MPTEPLTIADWLEQHRAGRFDTADHAALVAAGWMDWFAGANRMRRATQRFADVLERLTAGGLVDVDATRILMKGIFCFDLADASKTWHTYALYLAGVGDGGPILVDYTNGRYEVILLGCLDRDASMLVVHHCKRPEQVARWLNSRPAITIARTAGVGYLITDRAAGKPVARFTGLGAGEKLAAWLNAAA